MNYFEKMLLNYLCGSKIKMEITGFDTAGFQKAVQEEGKRRLEMIESIVFEDEDILSNDEKINSIRSLFLRDF